MLLGNPVEPMCEHQQLARHGHAKNQTLAFLHDFIVGDIEIGEPLVAADDFFPPRRLHEQAIERRQ